MADEQLYEVVRFYEREGEEAEVVATELTLAEAKDRCDHPAGSSDTATSEEARQRTNEKGRWFEGFRAE